MKHVKEMGAGSLVFKLPAQLGKATCSPAPAPQLIPGREPGHGCGPRAALVIRRSSCTPPCPCNLGQVPYSWASMSSTVKWDNKMEYVCWRGK